MPFFLAISLNEIVDQSSPVAASASPAPISSSMPAPLQRMARTGRMMSSWARSSTTGTSATMTPIAPPIPASHGSAVRVAMPNIAGYLAFTIPIAMSTGAALGLNPLVCGLAVVVVGDSVVYYPAGAASSVFIFHRAGISAPEVFRFGVVMTVVAIGVLFAVALPYWGMVGEGLVL